MATSSWNSLRSTRGFSAPQQPTDLLLKTVLATRLFIEEASLSTNSSSSASEIVTYYGAKIYKCTKPSCEYFSEGFPTKAKRDEHVGKHERAFICTAPGCPYQLLGFDTGVDLSMHSARVHGEQDARFTDAESFPVTIETVKIDEAIKKDSLPEVKLWLQKEMNLQGKSLGELSFAKLSQSLEEAINLGRMVIFEHLLNATRCERRHIAMLFSKACECEKDDIALFLLNHSEADPYGAKHPDSMALLCDALSKRRYEVIQFMLQDHTAVPNEKFPARSFSDAISAAVGSRDASLLKMLIGRHAVINGEIAGIPSDAAITAANNSNEEMIELLLDFPGCDINSTSPSGETALHRAVLCRMSKIIRTLFASGKCDVKARDGLGRTVLALASRVSTADIVRIILHSAEARSTVNVGDYVGYRPLHHAAVRGDKVITKLLLDVGKADPNAVTLSGITPMELAAMSKQRSIVEILMQSPNCQADSFKWMDVAQLFLAIEAGNITAAKQVLERDRIPQNVMALSGLTPLMLAVELQYPDLVTYLLSKAGFDPNLRKDHDPQGLTALHIAIQKRRIGVLNMLLDDTSMVDLSLQVSYKGITMSTLKFAQAVWPNKKVYQSLEEALERRDVRN
jgi:ankyrin repeat protein